MKEKIKIIAISLFNSHGISNVSMKQIADSLGISAGNLQYHFKDKLALLNHIYQDMHEASQHYILPKNSYITLFHFEEMMLKFDAIQQQYSFFFSDLVHIVKTYPIIYKQYEALNLMRFKEARKLIDYYIETDRLKPKPTTVNYENLMHLIWMTSTFWQSQKQIISNKHYEINKGSSIDMLWNLLFPYLTEKGVQEYTQFKKYTTQVNN